MAAVDIKVFSGIRPLIDPILLETPEGVIADNVQLNSGALAPLLGTTILKPLTKIAPQTIWRFGTSSTETEHWLEFASETDVMASPLPEDIWARAYWTDGLKPKYGPGSAILSGSSYPGASYDLGIPAPTVTPVVSAPTVAATPNQFTLSASQIAAITQAKLMKVAVTRTVGGNTSNTFGPSEWTQTGIATDLSTIPGLSTALLLDTIVVTMDSTVSSVNISVKSGVSLNYDPAVVTYTNHLVVGSVQNPVSGNYISAVVDGTLLRGVGDLVYVPVNWGPGGPPVFQPDEPVPDGGYEDPGTMGPAAAAFYASFISGMQPGDRWAIEVNGAAPVTVIIQAAGGTSPAVVTAESLRLSLAGVPSTVAEVRQLTNPANGQTGPGVVFYTQDFGYWNTLRVRKINPVASDIYSLLNAWTPAPAAPATAVTSESRTVVVTYVSAYGEEGPPSPASSVVSLDPSRPITYTNLGTAPSGNYNIATKRIYRSSAVGSSAQFQFVAEIPVAQNIYVDNISQANLGEILPSENWIAPPPGLKGLRMLASGAAIGFVGNTAYLSEPNLPHAWPHKYPIDFQIVGVAAFDQSAMLLTNGYPFILDGADPAAMTPRRLNLRQACVSKGSIVETEGGVIYASPDGLVSIDAGGAVLVSTKHYNRKQWQALNPSSFKAFTHDGRYIALYTQTDGTRGILIFDPSGQGPYLTTSSLNALTPITAAYSDARTDTLYLAHGDNIVRYNTGNPLTYTWRSKIFRLARPENLGVAAIDATAYPVTLKVYADGVLKQTKTVASAEPFKLKSGFKKNEWQFEISGTNEVKRLRVATSVDELKQLQ